MDEQIMELLDEIYRGYKEPTVLNDIGLSTEKKKALLALAKLIYGAEKDRGKFERTKAALISVLDTPFADDIDGTILEYINSVGT
ncbi:MAG: hypothetical protein JRN53_02750 [Nitrososphaerota archaeon]|nr:hypothetical protein [Nitrososphaerota archaeon]MDG7042033.1 hypothetical protein [Nitrososphaerota archaeon]MDG7046490.1 hypothetical protein [Nitrososphaerota archaeon]MDG7047605.1 hypothetical protein [Nitrososphaerota archaeon]